MVQVFPRCRSDVYPRTAVKGFSCMVFQGIEKPRIGKRSHFRAKWTPFALAYLSKRHRRMRAGVSGGHQDGYEAYKK